MGITNARFPRARILLITILIGIPFSGCDANSAKSQRTRYDDLVLQLDISRSRVEVGESILIRFTVKNVANEPIRIESKESPVLDVQVIDVNSHDTLFSWVTDVNEQTGNLAEWQAGETKIIETLWTPKSEDFYSGRTLHVAGFLSENSEIVQSAGMIICMGGCDR
ncbi:MAG: hypothetical protein B6D41_02640 [Chloroflexi bacterium UTCFX4]|jgi:hypothetical protein|nr:MAG: hypothetical protein B6D41_02640 [Chloroflexi bacterium UTCFX4]